MIFSSVEDLRNFDNSRNLRCIICKSMQTVGTSQARFSEVSYNNTGLTIESFSRSCRVCLVSTNRDRQLLASVKFALADGPKMPIPDDATPKENPDNFILCYFIDGYDQLTSTVFDSYVPNRTLATLHQPRYAFLFISILTSLTLKKSSLTLITSSVDSVTNRCH